MEKKNRLRKISIVTVINFSLFICFFWQFVMVQIENKTYSSVGRYVDVGSYQVHYYSQGEGNTVFVFITGSGTPCAYTDFFLLQNKLSKLGQTITFDHAGSGWSSNTNSPRTIENLVNELSILIDSVAENKSVILICHSMGSLEAIGYAQKQPEKVKGIIFLDSGSPEFYSTDSELLANVLNRSNSFIRVIGANRLLGQLGVLLPLYGENIRNQKLPQNIKDLDKAMYFKYTGNFATMSVIKQMNENANVVLKRTSLGEIPILVLSSASGDEWNEVQTQLALWSTNSKQVIIEHSEHYLYWSNFEEVSNNIDGFLEKIQTRQTIKSSDENR